MVVLNDHVTVFVEDIDAGGTSDKSVPELFDGLFSVHECLNAHAGDLGSAYGTILFLNDELL